MYFHNSRRHLSLEEIEAHLPSLLSGGHICAFTLHGKYQSSKPLGGPQGASSVYSFMRFRDKTAPREMNPSRDDLLCWVDVPCKAGSLSRRLQPRWVTGGPRGLVSQLAQPWNCSSELNSPLPPRTLANAAPSLSLVTPLLRETLTSLLTSVYLPDLLLVHDVLSAEWGANVFKCTQQQRGFILSYSIWYLGSLHRKSQMLPTRPWAYWFGCLSMGATSVVQRKGRQLAAPTRPPMTYSCQGPGRESASAKLFHLHELLGLWVNGGGLHLLIL